jgi:hypothetical protein
MKMSQWNSLCSFLKTTTKKVFFSKMENRKVKQVFSGVGISGTGEDIRKG